MNDNTPITPRPLHQLAAAPCQVMTAQELREHGVSAAVAHERCRPGGPWQMPLPGVFLLHSGPPSAAETLHVVLRYTGGRDGEAVVSGLAALCLHGLTGVPPLTALDRVDVLVPRVRRLRSVGRARIVRTHRLPRPVEVAGFPVAPVPRALADAIGRLPDALAVRRLLTEAVRTGFCEPGAVVRELSRGRVLGMPQVAAAIDTLRLESRTLAEAGLLAAVRAGGLPDPCWNVGLWLPDGPFLCDVDAYWPEPAVAAVIDARVPPQRGAGAVPAPAEDDATEADEIRRHQTLSGLGIRVARLTPRALRESPERQAAVLRTALAEAARGPRASYVVVLPR
ncbi:hypothetical protein [Streptomyces litchfieldiae]|uniref:Transcriptional regulator, AbiEi antitoxin, Type IV TA system n=1 Tax=Streptomyces litchfieldiae TaxID=3075543 RepID=A0ABU2MMS5_9ACTN|nr:hypothetical protein [Streptomyces sp. DSM 44938]MDT0342780.1 hypothetical protein [Streptomyces sp. DSM 44938]